ncbi:regulator of sigma E protease [Caldicoprobacter guelmensis]|uniref:RIP metalloprotease RseP n=1 Tax=Caldicoprobacter guelmensis TaxID=1170224 RepID=UPI00195906AA|nr:RIP metalloprotease RseP [Caldicoprobacter guelmensis]MBM7581418.1 regulator of sigma E protease [Caldicoprobacter guelmensis]
MLTLLVALLFFGVLIMVHELGHFLVGRLVGVHAEEFSIGMGPKLFGFSSKGTRFSVRALPIGGYVKFLGEDEKSDDPRAFGNASLWRRMAVIASGPAMNILLAIVLLAVFYMGYGIYEVVPEILQVVENSPADRAGLMPGDKILQVDGVSVEGMEAQQAVEAIRNTIKQKGGNELEIVVQRDGKNISVKLVPEYSQKSDSYVIGIVFGRIRRYSLMPAIGLAFRQAGKIMVMMVDMLRALIFRGQGLNEVMGPVGIVGEIGKAVQAGMQQLLSLAIIITLNLGVINLIPFPALDGGRLVLLLIEGVRGKPLEPEKEGFIHFIGFVVLILLMVLVTYQDIMR